MKTIKFVGLFLSVFGLISTGIDAQTKTTQVQIKDLQNLTGAQ